MGETYYDVLGVDPDATAEEIRTAYRERVLETHPDHNDAPDAAEQFKRVSTAESVLSDGAERARYDRLGHDAYVRMGERTAGGGSSGSADDSSDDGGESGAGTGGRTRSTTDSSASGSRTTSRSGRSASTTGSRSGRSSRRRASGGRTQAGRRTGSDSSGGGDGRTESHHARQRKRRRRERAKRRAAGGWSVGSDRSTSERGAGASAATTSGPSGVGAATATSAAGTATERDAGSDAESTFRYTVHDWTGEVELEWEGRPIDHSTAVAVGSLWLLYPVFVAVSLTTVFPLVINVVVAACTLALVGYVLTRPRIAAGLFGFWSLLFPIGLDATGAVEPFSITGLLALAFAWVPFGYAVALWWALRP